MGSYGKRIKLMGKSSCGGTGSHLLSLVSAVAMLLKIVTDDVTLATAEDSRDTMTPYSIHDDYAHVTI